MLLKELIELLDEDKTENLILYLYYKNKEGTDSYERCMMIYKDSVDAILKNYGDYVIEKYSIVSSKRYRAVYDFAGAGFEVLHVTLSDREVWDTEKDTIKETSKKTVKAINEILSDETSRNIFNTTINGVQVDETAIDLMSAASYMNKCNSIPDFLEFIYRNGYKIELVKDK